MLIIIFPFLFFFFEKFYWVPSFKVPRKKSGRKFTTFLWQDFMTDSNKKIKHSLSFPRCFSIFFIVFSLNHLQDNNTDTLSISLSLSSLCLLKQFKTTFKIKKSFAEQQNSSCVIISLLLQMQGFMRVWVCVWMSVCMCIVWVIKITKATGLSPYERFVSINITLWHENKNHNNSNNNNTDNIESRKENRQKAEITTTTTNKVILKVFVYIFITIVKLLLLLFFTIFPT